MKQVFFQLVQGTGPSGEVRAVDVENYKPSATPAPTTAPAAAAPSPAAAPAPRPAPGATYVDIPLSNMRKVRVILDTL